MPFEIIALFLIIRIRSGSHVFRYFFVIENEVHLALFEYYVFHSSACYIFPTCHQIYCAPCGPQGIIRRVI